MPLDGAQILGGRSPLVLTHRGGKPHGRQLRRKLQIAAVPNGFRSSFLDWAAERTNHPREAVGGALAPHGEESDRGTCVWPPRMDAEAPILALFSAGKSSTPHSLPRESPRPVSRSLAFRPPAMPMTEHPGTASRSLKGAGIGLVAGFVVAWWLDYLIESDVACRCFFVHLGEQVESGLVVSKHSSRAQPTARL